MKAATQIVEAIAAGDLLADETARTVMAVAKLAGADPAYIVTVMLLTLKAGHTGDRFNTFAFKHGRNLERMAMALLEEWRAEVAT